MQNSGQNYCDALVIGSGLSGLQFALEFTQRLPQARVMIVTKVTSCADSTSSHAQGGIAAVFSATDSYAAHIADTIRVGGELCHPEVVKACVEEGPQRVRDLIAQGVDFTLRDSQSEDRESPYDLTKEGGHSHRRILHATDQTGKAIIEALLKKVKANKNICLLEGAIAVDLLTDQKIFAKTRGPNAQCLGAYFLDIKTNSVFSVHAKITLLATGGAGKVYKYTSNPDANSGDGIAMAYRVGARICNMEFIQFHPTCLFHPEAKSCLLSESLRGEGAILLNKNGERFMEKYHKDKELAPRDVVALSIDKEIKKTGDPCVYLDIHHKDETFIKTHFPHNYATCLNFGFDLTKEPVPVVPAAHYTCGGVHSDLQARTNIDRLYVAGEVAHTGLHGANRLASNSLLEAAVFAYRAAEDAAKKYIDENLATEGHCEIPAWNFGFAKADEEDIIIAHNWDEVRTLMWNYVGIVRTNRRLEYAARRITLLKQEIYEAYWGRVLTRDLVELRNLVTVADLIVTSARLRKESRGLHQNLDYPMTDNILFQRDTIL